VEIRKAGLADAERIGDVDVEAFTNSGWGEAFRMAEDEALQEKRREEARRFCQLHPGWVYVAVEDGQVVGFTTLEYDQRKRTGRIENTAVLPAYSGRGISTKLVTRVVRELVRLGATHIRVHTTLVPAARRVYEKAGFKLAAQDGEDYFYEMTTPEDRTGPTAAVEQSLG